MSTEHSTGAAVGPYTLSPNGDILAADGTAIGRVPVRWNDLKVNDFSSPREGWAFAEERARAEGSLLAASWDFRAACEAAIRNAERWDDLDADSLAILAQMRAAVAKSYGLRPCDDPALVPEVLQAQPQCVHGLRVMDGRTCCPLHADAGVSLERHEGDRDHGALSWYTYVCDGYLEEKGREG